MVEHTPNSKFHLFLGLNHEKQNCWIQSDLILVQKDLDHLISCCPMARCKFLEIALTFIKVVRCWFEFILEWFFILFLQTCLKNWMFHVDSSHFFHFKEVSILKWIWNDEFDLQYIQFTQLWCPLMVWWPSGLNPFEV